MSHLEQVEYCKRVKGMFPQYFKDKKVLDVGSLDLNGNNKYLFEDCQYIGIDIDSGNNVDEVSLCHAYPASDGYFDVILSTECFEHDMYINLSMRNIVRMLKPNGLFFFTCATTGRPEHGTLVVGNGESPFTAKIKGWDVYYKNLTQQDIRDYIEVDKIFRDYKFETVKTDLYFWGVKNG